MLPQKNAMCQSIWGGANFTKFHKEDKSLCLRIAKYCKIRVTDLRSSKYAQSLRDVPQLPDLQQTPFVHLSWSHYVNQAGPEARKTPQFQ